MKVGYFNHFGSKEMAKAAKLYNRKHPKDRVELVSIYQDQIEDNLEKNKIDLAITDPRDNSFDGFKIKQLAEVSLVVLLQDGNFLKGQQTIEKEELAKIPAILIAKVEEEAGEVHYYQDLLKFTSPLIAVENYNEASLMATSGSGYFLMNEITSQAMQNDQLQKMFLLDNCKQLKEQYAAIYKNENQQINDYLDLLVKQLKQ